MNLEPANTRAGVLGRAEGRTQLLKKEIKTTSCLNTASYLTSEILGNDSATAEIETSSSSTEAMCSGPIMDPSPSFPSKVDVGLRQEADLKPLFWKDTLLLEFVK